MKTKTKRIRKRTPREVAAEKRGHAAGITHARAILEELSGKYEIPQDAFDALDRPAGCPLMANECPEHGYAHGEEADELRNRIQKLVDGDDGHALADIDLSPVELEDAVDTRWRERLQAILDDVDARDSLAFEEATDG
ncbi:MAG: hypothetical protein HOW73_47950 [Polyangiaceae bacterium]|nr:hypothetical protein [Polyangiaceae bacterium]